uniref:ATP citrate synthase n=1 Tax=Macrostomum lignano TaxID=282301 RepID=A0A1I8JP62_9PLAT
MMPGFDKSLLLLPSIQLTSGVDGLSGASGWRSGSGRYSNPGTKCIVWGMQQRSVQNCLDFDFSTSKCLTQCANIRTRAVMVNFASLRSAYDSTLEALQFPQIRVIAIIAEGIPENLSRRLALRAAEKSVTVIGGHCRPHQARLLQDRNTGGMMDNILNSKLYRPGSVAYVSRSGGMSNELNNIIALNARRRARRRRYWRRSLSGSTFLDHLLRYQADTRAPRCFWAAQEEWRIADALRGGRITKPMVAWCIGTCAGLLGSEVQFGHALAPAPTPAQETASAKNAALAAAGAHVPASFDQLGETIRCVYEDLVGRGVIVPKGRAGAPDGAHGLQLGSRTGSFMTSICDERGQELLYAGVPITEIINRDFGIGGVLSLLWFQRRLPKYACKFIEMCLIITADHGPASQALNNTIVCARRRGKDLIRAALWTAPRSSSATEWTRASSLWSSSTRCANGRTDHGHWASVKSINNPDMRVEILKKFALENFPASPMLHYALEVEKITTSKKPNLILNVDGMIGVAMVDLLRATAAVS